MPTLHTGSTIELKANLVPPSAPAMPASYDFARQAYYRGIGAVGYARAPPRIIPPQPSSQASSTNDAQSRSRLGAEPPNALPWDARIAIAIERARARIGKRIQDALPGELGVMANALMTGARSGISQTMNDLYRDAGIFHILSISGLHMAIMGGSVFFALRLLLATIPPLALRFPIKKWAAAAATAATFAYLLISGGAHPTIRSFIMTLIMFGAIMLDRPAIALRNVAIAALVILVVMPESLLSAGFQLSFAAVVALVAVLRDVSRPSTPFAPTARLSSPT